MTKILQSFFPKSPHKLSLIGAFIGYPLGKLILLIVTIGQYPNSDKQHNELFVALTPLWVFFIGVTLYFEFK